MNTNRPKLKFIYAWLKDQLQRKTWFKNFFITRTAWGVFSINSHIVSRTGLPKVGYNKKETAIKSAEKMSAKIGKHMSYYRCIYCGKYHLGKNSLNK